MGQVNSALESENGSTDLATSIMVGVPNGEDDSRGSSNQSGDGTNAAAMAEKLDSIQCVKTRIDMLIEDCLNVQNSNEEEAGEKSGKGAKDGEKDNHENAKKESSEIKKESKGELKNDDKDNDVDKDGEEGNKAEAEIKRESGDKRTASCNSDTNDKDAATAINQSKKECCSPVKQEGSSPDSKQVNSNSSGSGNSEHKTLKMSDLINEMNTTDMTQKHKKAITTFQTFIDKVLDTSLQQVTDQENIPKNILKLYQDSMSPPGSQEPAKDPSGLSSPKGEERPEGSVPGQPKPKFDKALTKIKPERKITLKDHIERFLELSFHEETGGGRLEGKPEDEKKEGGGGGTKNGHDNFNAQGLVNNMITQGLHINKLLSPPMLVNHSKNPQKSPDIRVRADFQRHDKVKEHQKAEHKQERQVPSISYKSEMPVNKNYSGYPGMHPRSGHHMPQLSPGQMNASNHDSHKMAVKDIRENHIHAQMQDSKNVYESNRRDYMYGRQYPSGPVAEQLPRPHPSLQGPGYHQKLDHAANLAGLEHPGHHPMMYGVPQSARTPSTAQYHHHLAVPHSMAMPHHGPTLEEQRSPLARPARHPLHHKDCVCPLCAPHHQPAPDLRAPDQKKMEYHAQRLSPNMPHNMPLYMAAANEMPPHMRGHPHDTTAAMMRQSHGKILAAAATGAYQPVPKLLPQHPPITSPKEYPPALMMPMAYAAGRRPSLPDNPPQRPYIQHPNSAMEYSQPEVTEDYHRRPEAMGRSGTPHSPYPPLRPSSMPSQDNTPHESYPVQHSPDNSDSGSHSSEASTEAPLDLSVKKLKSEMERPRSSSYSSGGHPATPGEKKLNPSNTFLRFLEHSLDKYCQEQINPADHHSSMKPGRPQMTRLLTPGDTKQSLPYPAAPGQRLPSPHNLYSLQQQQRKLPSPHFTGGITMGQPLVESKSQPSVPRSAEVQYGLAAPNSGSPVSTLPQHTPGQAPTATTPSNIDSKRQNINTISKHEPMQNIIGNHDPNDILYLICKICTQTYGSPYGFRKHFRNQHGFEPRAEHTIVQTISATKTALHGPVVVTTTATGPVQPQQTGSPSAVKLEVKESMGFVPQSVNPEADRKSCSGSPLTRRCPSESGSEHSDKSVKCEKLAPEEHGERKCLECPECGRAFQLNDFGSFKRHCRQHSSAKPMGPFTCSDCHLSFPDQKALKEHFISHVNESHTSPGKASPSAASVATVTRPSLSQTCFSCIKCEQQFDNETAYSSHMRTHEQQPHLSPEPSDMGKNKRTVTTAQSHTTHSVSTSLNVIPSQCIVKQAAESMTAQACPDSSWDDSVKPVPVSSVEKGEETAVENYDSGYSSSVGSNSQIHPDEKLNENVDKSPAGAVFRQKSVDSNSENNEEIINGVDSFFYKHKKFSHYRKRESLLSHSTDTTPPKQARLSDVSSERRPPVSSSTTLSVDFKQCDSSQSEEIKSVDTIKPELTDSSDASSAKNREAVEKQVKDFNLGKAEARHNLPFVWDRTTRSQRKTK